MASTRDDNSIRSQKSFQGHPEGVTTFGEEIEAHEISIKKEVSELEKYTTVIRKFLDKGREEGDADYFLKKRILVAHFNYYCPERIGNPKYLLPAEFAVTPFSIEEGLLIKEGLSGLINPVTIPLGLRSEAKEMSEQLCVPMIGRHLQIETPGKVWEPKEAFEFFELFSEEYGLMIDGKVCIFVKRDNIAIADRCLKYMKLESDAETGDDHKYVLIPLSIFTIELASYINAVKAKSGCPKIPNEGAAERILDHSQYTYAPELGCYWHSLEENQNKVESCAQSIVHRMIYNILGYFGYFLKIALNVPTHAPALSNEDVVDRKAMRDLAQMYYRAVEIDYDSKLDQ